MWVCRSFVTIEKKLSWDPLETHTVLSPPGRHYNRCFIVEVHEGALSCNPSAPCLSVDILGMPC